MANLVQRWHKNHARIGLQFPLFHTGLACSRMVFFECTISWMIHPSLAQVWEPRCKGDLPCGRERSALVSRPFRCSASTARLESASHFVRAISCMAWVVRLLYSFSGVLLGSSLCTKTFWLKDLHLRHPFHFYMCMGFQLAFSHASGHAFHFMLSLLS